MRDDYYEDSEYFDDYDVWEEELARRAEKRRRAREAQARRREREKKRRKAQIALTIGIVVALAAAALIVLFVRSEIKDRLLKQNQQKVVVAGTEGTEAIVDGAGDGSSEAVDPLADPGENPTTEQVDAAREAKALNSDVAALWPFNSFKETDATVIIPSVPGYDEEFKESFGVEFGDNTVYSNQQSPSAGTGSTIQALKDHKEIPSGSSVGDDYVGSKYALVVNADTGEIVAEKNAFDKMVPASMTKVMTVLVAAEHLKSEDSMRDMVTLTAEDEEYAYINGSSAVCWMPDDTASVEDLFYGTILPSGADAAVALAEYTSGTHEEFVKLMNTKAEELGISKTTHFTNCVGVMDDDHYSTAYDMAVVMKAAMENDIVRKVMTGHTWTTSPTSVHPEGITVSNWFLRRIEDLDNGGLVQCAKTGFVNESGSCAVSFFVADSGTHYIACTANAISGWRCIYDHSALYREYGK